MTVTKEFPRIHPRGMSPQRGMMRFKYSLPLVFYFVVFSGSIYLLFGTFDEGELSEKSGGSPLYMGLLLITYSMVLLQLAMVRGAALGVVFRSLPLLAFVCCGFLSLIVAGAAGISVMRYCLLIATIAAGLLISVRYSLDEFCETFFWTSFTVTVAHFLAYPLLSGRIVYDPLERGTLLGLTSYAGLFPHKSVAATFFSLALVISVARYLGAQTKKTKRSSIALAFLSFIALLLCGAVGRLLFLLISAVVTMLVRAFLARNTRMFLLLGGAIVSGGIFYFLMGDSGWIFFFGRSWSLTGREELFQLWPRFFLDKPLLGYGFDGFFTDVAGAPGSYLADLAGGRGFSTFESVYLDLLIQFGAMGAAFFCWMLLVGFGRSVRFYLRDSSKYKVIPLLLIIWTVLGSALDSGILTQNSLACVIAFWIYFGVDRAYRSSSKRGPALGRLKGNSFTRAIELRRGLPLGRL
ncbi:O-antigen ligase family protein [Bradyrhizobium sp.]|uniref:O-antigen ligase family protein n=1 Tax=Bradyrhizobium sp. TaxID=376 RepID=UPI0039E4C828